MIEKCKIHAVKEVLETIKRSKTQISMETLMESRVISALDGVLNPKTFEITEHSPDYLTTTKLPFNFKSDSNNNKLCSCFNFNNSYWRSDYCSFHM